MSRTLVRLLAPIAALAVALGGVAVTAVPASAASCGTSFAGFGDSMSQTYKNCWGNAWVTPAYTKNGGALNFFAHECTLAGNGETVTWNHPYTISGATYTTVFCTDFAINEIWFYDGGAPPCWTKFSPTSPQGGPMSHSYGNCGSHTYVAPAYHQAGTWHVDNSMYYPVEEHTRIEWRYSSTVANANYTTVFSVFTPNLT